MKKLPTKLKLIKGTHRPERENPNEPEYKIEIPDYPAHLSTRGRREWKRMSEVLFNMGLLTEVDMAALSAYCQFYGRWAEAEANLKKTDLVIKTKSGNIIQNPYIGIANTAFKLMKDCLTEFGMTPASRSRVSAKEEKKKEDPWDQFGDNKKNGKK